MGTRARIGLELADGSILSAYHHWDGYVKGVYGPQYYSQRGEFIAPRHDKDLNEYLCNGEEYAYLFTNGEWVCYSLYGGAHPDIVKEVEIPSGALAV